MSKNSFAELNSILEAVLAYRSSKPLLVALHYDLFTWIERRFCTTERLAAKLTLDVRALGILLDAIADLGWLRKKGRIYSNTVAARKFLVSSSPSYIGNNLRYQEQTWEAWSDLKHVVKSGRPSQLLMEWIHKDAFTEEYIKAMGDVARGPARDLAGKLDLGGRALRTLDVGCGSGAYSAAFVERNPGIEATLLDLPKTLGVTQRLLSTHRHARRFKYRAADFLKDGFGDSEYDLVLISNVTHVESAANNRKLVAKAHRALRPGGRLVIHDYVAGDRRGKSSFSATLGLHLLVFTGRGNVYTLEEYADWMRKDGFKPVSHRPVASGSLYPSVAVIGRKP
jgi:3-hydroxy-5-methyl-1-naphthoate 3-O-methyltransferase